MKEGVIYMSVSNKVSTGISGFDQVIDMLRLGDNVVWQVESIQDYFKIVEPYIKQAKKDNRKLIYFRFGSHLPLMTRDEAAAFYEIDASQGFESFATKIHNIIEQEGFKAFYVFDCLSDLLKFWYSDLMIGNFFRVTCPFLYQLDTIAYFAILRGVHTHSTIARIRETTQLLLDLYTMNDKTYIHPLKVWERYSPTMFFPHLISGDEAISITASAEAAELFSGLGQVDRSRDYWEITMEKACAALKKDEKTQNQVKKLLISLIIGKDSRIVELSERYFTLQDLLNIASREIGSGFIGGKSVGMLLARAILETNAWDTLKNRWEPHDSYYLGSDVFYTYIVQNGWWELHTKQKTPEGYFTLAPELQEKLLRGKFPGTIKEQLMQMLERYGQSPIIVRSSSLLEDNFGNAFAGKYESVFCANQGSPEERYDAFEQALRIVYASTMSENALAYRQSRGLTNKDEQMAILIQRVSGDHYEDLFFPHIAGVANSSNLYVWNKEMNPNAGMLRLVFGLGTHAVDRISGDYARIVPLDMPASRPPINYGDEKKFSQHSAEVLNLRENRLSEVSVDTLSDYDLGTDKKAFFSIDLATVSRLREMGRQSNIIPKILDFKNLLTKSDFPKLMRTVLATLESAYDYPVDIEFTANLSQDGNFKFNLLQCRPLQTKGLGKAIEIPHPKHEDIFFSTTGNFMGGNIRLPLEYVIFVKAETYLKLSERGKYQVARTIGILNQKLKNYNVLLMGPGRWGTTTPSLGVPVHFSELCNMAAICEVSYKQAGLMPELSFGSHFFQDIVESDIFYAAIFEGESDVIFQPEKILVLKNLLGELLPEEREWEEVIFLTETTGLTLYSDIISQRLLCFR